MSNYLAIHIRPDADIQSLVNAGDWDAIAARPSVTTQLDALKQYAFSVHPRWQR